MAERINLALRRFIGRVSIAPFRVVAYFLHATGLERIYKPRFTRYSALFDLTDEMLSNLPKYCYSVSGGQMDPMNLVIVGDEASILERFKAAGWHRANPASPIHLAYSLIASLTRKTYRTGPFTPLYVNIGLQDFAFQQVTKEGNFKRRHHLRIWKTGSQLPNGKRLWVGACSFDTNLKIQFRPPFIHHAIDPNLDQEREYVVRSLESYGAVRIMAVPMTPHVASDKLAKNAYGAEYYTDGRAVVVEL